VEIEACRADGSPLLIEATVRPIFKGRYPLFTAFLKNVTQR
jgi:hypothetical protein